MHTQYIMWYNYGFSIIIKNSFWIVFTIQIASKPFPRSLSRYWSTLWLIKLCLKTISFLCRFYNQSLCTWTLESNSILLQWFNKNSQLNRECLPKITFIGKQMNYPGNRRQVSSWNHTKSTDLIGIFQSCDSEVKNRFQTYLSYHNKLDWISKDGPLMKPIRTCAWRTLLRRLRY